MYYAVYCVWKENLYVLFQIGKTSLFFARKFAFDQFAQILFAFACTVCKIDVKNFYHHPLTLIAHPHSF